VVGHKAVMLILKWSPSFYQKVYGNQCLEFDSSASELTGLYDAYCFLTYVATIRKLDNLYSVNRKEIMKKIDVERSSRGLLSALKDW